MLRRNVPEPIELGVVLGCARNLGVADDNGDVVPKIRGNDESSSGTSVALETLVESGTRDVGLEPRTNKHVVKRGSRRAKRLRANTRSGGDGGGGGGADLVVDAPSADDDAAEDGAEEKGESKEMKREDRMRQWYELAAHKTFSTTHLLGARFSGRGDFDELRQDAIERSRNVVATRPKQFTRFGLTFAAADFPAGLLQTRLQTGHYRAGPARSTIDWLRRELDVDVRALCIDFHWSPAHLQELTGLLERFSGDWSAAGAMLAAAAVAGDALCANGYARPRKQPSG